MKIKNVEIMIGDYVNHYVIFEFDDLIKIKEFEISSPDLGLFYVEIKVNDTHINDINTKIDTYLFSPANKVLLNPFIEPIGSIGTKSVMSLTFTNGLMFRSGYLYGFKYMLNVAIDGVRKFK